MVTSIDATTSAQQYFPTYRIPPDSEIALREYDLSFQGLAADQKGISVVAGLLVLLGGGAITVLASDRGTRGFLDVTSSASRLQEILIYSLVFMLTLIAIRYLTELQKSAAYGSRKIIVLRRMLGVDYGNIERVLPASRLEGANEPFAIPLFPGYGSTVSLAALAIASVSASAVFGGLTGFSENINSIYSLLLRFWPYSKDLASLVTAFSFFCLLVVFYRFSLREEWETTRFWLSAKMANVLKVPIKRRIGHVIYRMELSVYEAIRLGIDLDRFFLTLVRIEDRGFYIHSGNSYRAAVASLYRRFKYKSRGGASTIGHQLIRSNFISRIPPGINRKIVEWMLAPWIIARYDRSEVLRLYLCSVRFARGVEGVPAALRFYFEAPLNPQNPWNPSKAQILFLIERLSNVSSSIPLKRIRALVADAKFAGLVNVNDVGELKSIYEDQIKAGRLKDPGAPIII